MEPKVLADALVEAGIGYQYHGAQDHYGPCRDNPDWHKLLTADEFITDWRVAGKVLESMSDRELILLPTRKQRDPRAIIEAWYAATEHE